MSERYKVMYNKECGLVVADMSTNPRICSARRIYDMEIIDELNKLSNENEQLKEDNKELELENMKHIGDGEWDIRDTTYSHGKFRLEEWGERYHQFYDGDKALEDEEVVSLLFENEQIKQDKEVLMDFIKKEFPKSYKTIFSEEGGMLIDEKEDNTKNR